MWILFVISLVIVGFGAYVFGTGYESRYRRRETARDEAAYKRVQRQYILTPKSPSVPKKNDDWDGAWL